MTTKQAKYRNVRLIVKVQKNRANIWTTLAGIINRVAFSGRAVRVSPSFLLSDIRACFQILSLL